MDAVPILGEVTLFTYLFINSELVVSRCYLFLCFTLISGRLEFKHKSVTCNIYISQRQVYSMMDCDSVVIFLKDKLPQYALDIVKGNLLHCV